MGSLVGLLSPSLVGCQALPCADAAGYWLVRPGHEAARCRTLAGSGLLLARWWAESVSRRLQAVACPMVGDARSWG